MSNTIVAVYDNVEDAQKVRQALQDIGFAGDAIKLTSSHESAARTNTGASATHADSPGSGIGNFFRSLFDMDEDQDHRDVYAESVRRGSQVLTAHPASEQQADDAIQIMNSYGPVDVAERSAMWKTQGWKGYDEGAPMLSSADIEKERSSYAGSGAARQTELSDATTIPVIQEQLQVGKRVVQRGGVRVFQRVTETPVEQSVNLRQEHVVVERHAVDQKATAADLTAFKDGTIEVTERAEEAVISKTARVVEEVVIGKSIQDRTETISDTVRRTDVDVQQLDGDTRASLNQASAVSPDFEHDFRNHWQTSYATQGGRYEDYDTAYQYGAQMGTSDLYNGRKWDEVEPDLRGRWESSGRTGLWEQVKDAVRYGAERVTDKR